MAVNNVRNIAPFINDEFVITSKWWNERINPITGETEIHRGLDIATSGSKNLYSILNGVVHSKGTFSDGGIYIIIKDDNIFSSTYGYATMYLHLASVPEIEVGARVIKGQFVGIEGQSGQATGIHLHLEMQNLNRFNNQWHWSYNKSDYIDPTVYMGIDNVEGTSWLYDGHIEPVPVHRRKTKFKWVLYSRKIREKTQIK